MANAQMILKEHTTKNDLLYIAFELSNGKWKLLFSNGVKRRQKTIDAREVGQLEQEISKAKKRFKMAAEVRIVSCYEAGRDGFWLHRYLSKRGIENRVVDSSSIEVNRRKRREGSDRIDAEKLLNMLVRYEYGERGHWSVLRVPTEAEEDARRVNREIGRLKKERTAHTNRIKSLLALQGVGKVVIGPKFEQQLEQTKIWNGEEVPEKLKDEVLREYERYKVVQEHIKQLRSQQRDRVKAGQGQMRQVGALRRLKGIGPVSSWDLVFEFFGWRKFSKGKQVGAAAGLAPTPYDSGNTEREQGISKAGNRRVRSIMIEVGWQWLRYQPESQLSLWFEERFSQGGKRMRKVGIVALARKLLIALWRYLEQGIVPEGARLKAAI